MDQRNEANRLIAYHANISGQMTLERTALESALIPVSAYILVAAAEAWYRHPEMIAAMDAAGPPPTSAPPAAARAADQRRLPVVAANIYLIGRKLLTTFEVVEDVVEPTFAMLDFWERAALGYRADGHRQAWDAGFVLRPYDDDVIATCWRGAPHRIG